MEHMETCKQVIEVLTEYLEGDLPAADHQVFEQHMDGCRPCDAFFRTYRKSSEMAREALHAEDIPPELRQRVHDFLQSQLGLAPCRDGGTPGTSAHAGG